MNEQLGEVLIGREELAAKVAELGQAIARDYAGRVPVLVGVLKGAAMFMMDLIRATPIPLEIDFMAVSSYGAATESSGVVRILKDLDAPIVDRHVILVEDIMASGMTMAYVLDMLRRRNPASLRIAALLVKERAAAAGLNAHYRGFTIPERFVVGYGLDFQEQYRNLPYIATLDNSEHTAPVALI